MNSIVVTNLNKSYISNFSIIDWFLTGIGFDRNRHNNSSEITYALHSINFNVKKGEAFGIIGRNGAGKSTLLQIIAGTLKLSSGSVFVNGRVSALLELGSGFNPDFTGRENIYLSGSITGITRELMDSKVTQIIEFADIGNFIDQPVRTYSTGMLMRVAFAVAIAVEPEILIIDEALSVGDILFQQKCHVRLKQLMESGVTLLVVTHDTGFVLNLCNRALWLDKGKQMYLGEASACVNHYLAAMGAIAGNSITDSSLDKTATLHAQLPQYAPIDFSASKQLGDKGIRIDKFWIIDEFNHPVTVFIAGKWVELVIVVTAANDLELVSAGCELRNKHGQVVFATGLRVVKRLIPKLQKDESRVVTIRFKIELAPGQYTLDVGCGAGEYDTNTWHRVLAAAVLEVALPPDQDVIHGLVRLPYEIETRLVS